MPIAPLMTEHRLIERMIKLTDEELREAGETGKVDLSFLDVTIDFLKTYADRCHHGKEEGTLFKDLAKKKVSDVQGRFMRELTREHVDARKTVNSLENAEQAHIIDENDSSKDIATLLKELVEFLSYTH